MEAINQQIEKFDEARKLVQVKKAIPMTFDLGLLSGFDINTLDQAKFKKGGDDLNEYLKEICRDGVQLLLNEVFQLPVIATENGVMASLPKPTTILPREKSVPKAKPMTRWEKFAKAKGIVNRKRERMIFDEESGEYRPRYGYKGMNQVDKDWVMEVPENADPNADLYSLARSDKKARVEKNQSRQLRNEREAAGTPKEVEKSKTFEKKPNNPSKPTNKKGLAKQSENNQVQKEKATKIRGQASERKEKLQRDAVLASVSTASLGKFDKKIKGEAKPKGIKRKFDPTAAPDLKEEKEATLKIINKLTGGSAAKATEKKNLVNTRRAVKESTSGTGNQPRDKKGKFGKNKKR